MIFASGTKYYVPVTISNNQSTATPGTFQVQVTVNSSTYSSYLASNLSNVNWQDGAGNILNSWLESGNSNSATASVYWIKLTSSIPANSSVTVYLCFYATSVNNFNTIDTGEAPMLSGTYGQYDNGSNVFSLYANGNTPISDFTVSSGLTLTQQTGVSYGGTTINALKLTGYPATGGMVSFYLNTSSLSPSSSYISEANAQAVAITGAGDQALVSLIQSPSSAANAISTQGVVAFGDVYFCQDYIAAGSYNANKNPQGTGGTSWIYGSITYIAGSGTYSAYNAPQLYSTTGGYSGTTTNPISSSGSNIFLGTIGSLQSGAVANAYYNFFRTRAYPPNAAMPSSSFGSVTSVATVWTASASVSTSNAASRYATTSSIHGMTATAIATVSNAAGRFASAAHSFIIKIGNTFRWGFSVWD